MSEPMNSWCFLSSVGHWCCDLPMTSPWQESPRQRIRSCNDTIGLVSSGILRSTAGPARSANATKPDGHQEEKWCRCLCSRDHSSGLPWTSLAPYQGPGTGTDSSSLSVIMPRATQRPSLYPILRPPE